MSDDLLIDAPVGTNPSAKAEEKGAFVLTHPVETKAEPVEPDGVEVLIPDPGDALTAGRKRTREQRDQDYEFIRINLKRRKTVAEIARRLSEIRPYKISRQQIARDIVTLDRRAKEYRGAFKPVNVLRENELDYLEYLESELHGAWEKSKQAAKALFETREFSTKKDGSTSTSPTRVTRRTMERDGDVAFIRELRAIAEVRCKILGLFAPTEVKAEINATVDHGAEIQHLRAAFERRYGIKLQPLGPIQQQKRLTE